MLTTHPRPGIFATMHRVAVRDSRHPVPGDHAALVNDVRDPFRNTHTEQFRRWFGRVGPASEFFAPPDALTATAPLNVPDYAVPVSLVRLGPYWGPYIHDSLLGLFEPERRPYSAQMFERHPGAVYVTRFVRGMNDADSPDFDDFVITQFDNIKRLYAIVGRNVRLCIPSRVFAVGLMDGVDRALPLVPMDRLASSGIVFDRVNQNLVISTGGGEPRRHPFTAGVETAERRKFIDRLNDRQVDFTAERLVDLFDGVASPLRAVASRRCRFSTRHGPGYAEAYFPEHRYPAGFAQRSMPRDDEVPPLHLEGAPKASAPRFSLRPPVRAKIRSGRYSTAGCVDS